MVTLVGLILCLRFGDAHVIFIFLDFVTRSLFYFRFGKKLVGLFLFLDMVMHVDFFFKLLDFVTHTVFIFIFWFGDTCRSYLIFLIGDTIGFFSLLDISFFKVWWIVALFLLLDLVLHICLFLFLKFMIWMDLLRFLHLCTLRGWFPTFRFRDTFTFPIFRFIETRQYFIWLDLVKRGLFSIFRSCKTPGSFSMF